MKEKVLAVTFDKEPDYHDRHIKPGDDKIVVKDKKGNNITLADHKKLYPYKLDNDIACTIVTNKRSFTIEIHADYCWNGADIPPILWVFVGSKDSPQFKVPSLIHDYLLEYKSSIYILIFHADISVAEYRRLTSLIFRDLLKTYGTKTIKSNIMSGAVQLFQATLNRHEWKI